MGEFLKAIIILYISLRIYLSNGKCTHWAGVHIFMGSFIQISYLAGRFVVFSLRSHSYFRGTYLVAGKVCIVFIKEVSYFYTSPHVAVKVLGVLIQEVSIFLG